MINFWLTLQPVWANFARAFLPNDVRARAVLKQRLTRVIIATNLLLGTFYITWRWGFSINFDYWWIGIPLILAETYSYLDSWLFGAVIWRVRMREQPPPPPPHATVDVFITCYNEPIELVRETARAAKAIRYPHTTFVLDDGNAPAMRAMAEQEGVGYLVRSLDWKGKERHAKSGNLNNALFQTTGEFILILDADQIPDPDILDRTLGYFRDLRVAFVQTPQWFYNTPKGDPFGSDAPLFYGPIQQGKDGWNAAFFCGSNAVLRREALMQVGIKYYVQELAVRVRRALNTADRVLDQATRNLKPDELSTRDAIGKMRAAVRGARHELRAGTPIQNVTWRFQHRAREIAKTIVAFDLAQIRAELADIPGIEANDLDASLSALLDDDEALGELTGRSTTPLAAIETVRGLLTAVDMDRADEALPVMPFARISVTEDMATAMRMHALHWKSVYHHEVLAKGLAPEDLRTALQQRLRWAQGTIQVMLRENPWRQNGLSFGQKTMYWATMSSYLSGFFALVYIAAPILYLFFGWLPVRAYSWDFFWHLIPYFVVNQLLFIVVGWKLQTWRGQQYSLALFPLWIRAVWTAAMNVYRGDKLGFVVTPKSRQGGVSFRIVQWQIIAMILLVGASIYGLARLAFGFTEDGVPILINVAWAIYDLIALSVVLDAALYQPDAAVTIPLDPNVKTAALAHGRVGTGQR